MSDSRLEVVGVPGKEYHTWKRTAVYHIYRDCSVGNNIDPGNDVPGKGGKRLCSQCAKRQQQGTRRRKR